MTSTLRAASGTGRAPRGDQRARVVVAMSGGVDSSVAAALMREEGHEVIGVTLKLLERMETGFGCCGSPQDVEDAARVCERLGIPHYTVDLWELFESRVVSPFVEHYLSGRTPNPCVECNRTVKFDVLWRLTRAWQAELLATGHYARVETGGSPADPHRLRRAVDECKDQSYFLYMLSQEVLNRVVFPLGGLTKRQVRQKARELRLPTAAKPESQEICFVPRRDYRGFVRSRVAQGKGDASGLRPGPILDRSGRFLGTHRGLMHYTIGQRSGLGISLGRPVYVSQMHPESSTLVVAEAREAGRRFCRLREVHWISGPAPSAVLRGPAGAPEGPSVLASGISLHAQVRVRHRHPPAPAQILVFGEGGEEAEVEFEDFQWAIAPGQSAVFYRGSEVLGGGIIEKSW